VSVLVDTSVWSLVLRRKEEQEEWIGKELAKLIDGFRIKIIGPIRQEILSGIPDKKAFEALRLKLDAFDDVALRTEDFERAAAFYNECRKKGVQGSHIDFLICAVAYNRGFTIFTLDRDFSNYGKVIDIVLHPY
jgi:predicted nucleic acid-binding protein